ncbi:hypothetical protein, partial [Streptomyces sp. NPDC057428]|uniref:hypothetical protein n=1 Tax=Streptomyces sp. NPDC057428 TaxID=3346129 RepID=UPI0036BBE7D1
AGSVKNSHHRRPQGTSSFPEKLSTGIKPVDSGSSVEEHGRIGESCAFGEVSFVGADFVTPIRT